MTTLPDGAYAAQCDEDWYVVSDQAETFEFWGAWADILDRFGPAAAARLTVLENRQ